MWLTASVNNDDGTACAVDSESSHMWLTASVNNDDGRADYLRLGLLPVPWTLNQAICGSQPVSTMMMAGLITSDFHTLQASPLETIITSGVFTKLSCELLC